jgi:ubiquinone/menaquinone biosynthesis C-methylase UbiE
MEKSSAKSKMLSIYNNCQSDLKQFEIWPDYYKVRYEEFVKFLSIFPQDSFESTLEIACGIGYQASFLSCISNEVIASDVDFGDMIQHSRGLKVTKDFISKNGIENVKIEEADAQNLQYQDEQFDFIFCSYSLQCMPDMDKALQEIKRVLKKDGYFFCTIPTPVFTLRIAGKYYKAILKRLFSFGAKKPAIVSVPQQSNEGVKKGRKWYTKIFPASDHGSFFKELSINSVASWERLFKKNGLKVVTKKYSSFNPEEPSPKFFAAIKEKYSSYGIIFISKK